MNEIPEELKKTIESYKFTVVCLSLVILASIAIFTWVLLIGVPKTLLGIVHSEVQTAFDENLQVNP